MCVCACVCGGNINQKNEIKLKIYITLQHPLLRHTHTPAPRHCYNGKHGSSNGVTLISYVETGRVCTRMKQKRVHGVTSARVTEHLKSRIFVYKLGGGVEKKNQSPTKCNRSAVMLGFQCLLL